MAAWLWVFDLTGSDNDWMDVVTFAVKPRTDATFVVLPDRLRPQVLRWMINATAKDVVLAVGSQLEYRFADAIVTNLSSDGTSDRLSFGISFTNVEVSYSGEP
jgi:hypothetical protein